MRSISKGRIVPPSNELDHIFRRYHRDVTKWACRYLGDKDAAKDVTQEVFLRAMNAHKEVAALEDPLGWLQRIATNLCLNRLRDTERRRRILNRQSPVSATEGDVPANAALTLRALLRDVPEDLREMAIYYFVDRMTQEQISSILGIPRRKVRYRLQEFRACALSSALGPGTRRGLAA